MLAVAPASDLAELIEFSVELAQFAPAILERIEEDLETHALAKKQERLEHKRFVEEQTPALIDVPREERNKLKLEVGRPRMSPVTALVFLMLRGWLGGCKEQKVRTMIRESKSLEIFLANKGESLPAPSTLHENLNAIRDETLQEIHRAELALVLEEGLDQFDLQRIDSTQARSASAYPTDSATIAKLLCRMCTRLENLQRLELKVTSETERLAELREEIRRLNYRIGTLTSSSANETRRAQKAEEKAKGLQSSDNKGERETESAKKRLRRELYEELYEVGEKALSQLERLFSEARNQVERQRCAPGIQRRREQFVTQFEEDLESVRIGIARSRQRVCEGKKPSAKNGMPLSVSDPSASFIEKGSWERTFGYRPQLCFSRTNLVTSIIVPEGNASDAGQLLPTLGESIANTKVVPKTVTLDDGYTGSAQLSEALALGVDLVSFSGARGKTLLGVEKWDSPPYCEARRARNGAESGIYALKKKVGFEQLASCGIQRVRMEQRGKVLSYNALKILELRRRRKKNAQLADAA